MSNGFWCKSKHNKLRFMGMNVHDMNILCMSFVEILMDCVVEFTFLIELGGYFKGEAIQCFNITYRILGRFSLLLFEIVYPIQTKQTQYFLMINRVNPAWIKKTNEIKKSHKNFNEKQFLTMKKSEKTNNFSQINTI